MGDDKIYIEFDEEKLREFAVIVWNADGNSAQP